MRFYFKVVSETLHRFFFLSLELKCNNFVFFALFFMINLIQLFDRSWVSDVRSLKMA